jgi:hypothetical protein
MVKLRETERINFYIDETARLEETIRKEMGEFERKKQLELIEKYYRKLIEHYSARTNPYYLIYVNKLNNLYAKYFVRGQPEGSRSGSEKSQ